MSSKDEIITSSCRTDEVVLINAADIEPVPIEWVWRDWLALGKLHLLAGMPGQGKTTLALAVASIISTGGCWPDGSNSLIGNVLIWSGEDGIEDTLLPRLIACGANRANIYFIDGRLRDDIKYAFDPSSDLSALKKRAESIGNIKLIIIDPIVSVINGDSHKNTEVRRGLQPIVDLAKSLNAAILGITHFSKGGSGTDPTSRVTGSIAFSAVARLVWVVAKVKSTDGEDVRILTRSKNNIGPEDGGFEYAIDQIEISVGISASLVIWGDQVHGSALDLLSTAEANKSDEKTIKKNETVEQLRTLLVSDCWTPASTCYESMIATGLTKKQIWNASKKLGVITQKNSMTEGWYWRLPPRE